MYKPTFQDVRLRVSNWIAGGLPIPRPRYITAVAGAPSVEHFLSSGKQTMQSISDMLVRGHRDPAMLGDVLDFGCGCGRVLRHWNISSGCLRLHGTDYNRALIAWCRRNYPFADFRVNELDGRLDYADASFDFVYAWSVFTHLTASLEDHWIGELARVLRPGGILFASFHGEFYASSSLSPEELARFRAGETIVHRGHTAGTNTCATFHSRPAVLRAFAPRFEVVDFYAGPPPLAQDQYLMCRRELPVQNPVAP